MMLAPILVLSAVGLGAAHVVPASKTVNERQVWWGFGGSSGGISTGLPSACLPVGAGAQQTPCLLPPITGPMRPGKERRQGSFGIGGSSNDKTKAIAALELQLLQLQNKRNPTEADLAQIEALQAMILYTMGITSISAPPGVGSTFTHPKKRFYLPPDLNTDINHAVDELERQLEALQNKRNKTSQDYDDIRSIKKILEQLVGITSISAPPGSSTTFHPGKREDAKSYSSECPAIDGVAAAFTELVGKDKLTQDELLVASMLYHVVQGCSDSTTTKSSDVIFSPLGPVDTEFDASGIQTAYDALTQSTEGSSVSLTNWLIAQHLADLLELYHVQVSRPLSPTPTTVSSTPTKRQIAIGTAACELANIMSLKAALAALMTAYGDPRRAPQNVFLIEQVIVTALQLCGQSVDGWTTLTPGDPQPGGPINPDPYQPGSPLKPGRKREAPIADPSALLAALQLLEQKYGAYGSGTIPAPVFLIMLNMVTILQGIPGINVPGWPVLGQGSVTIGPST